MIGKDFFLLTDKQCTVFDHSRSVTDSLSPQAFFRGFVQVSSRGMPG